MTDFAAPQRASEATSRLPNVGTTIFTVMSALATKHDAVNLGQGFPDFDCDSALVDAVTRAMQGGHNQYPPMAGVSALRVAIAEKIARLYGHHYDPESEITVTAGATQALLTAILALVHPGDEAIVIEPAYDSYAPAITLAGGVPVFAAMRPPAQTDDNFSIAWHAVRAAITPRTRLLIVNSPHNPTGTVLREADLLALQEIVLSTGIAVVADEVYEHMIFDGARHESIARYPALAERSVVISSFGKTYHVTGWKVGYAAAPHALMNEFRKVHQFNVFTVNTPMQVALAEYMRDPTPYLTLAHFYAGKRDFFRAGLNATRFKPLPSYGTYFQLADYSAIRPDLSEADFCQWLTSEIGVAAIPVAAFYDSPRDAMLVRFCFAKKGATLARALERLAGL